MDRAALDREMGKLAVVATTVFAFFSVENAVAWDLGIDDRSCYVPPQISCGGCAIACRLDKSQCAGVG